MDHLTVTAEPYLAAQELTLASVTEMRAMYAIEDDFTDVAGHHFDPPDGVFVVARLDGSPVGCGGLRRFDARSAEIKRMYTDPSVRSRGVARRVLDALFDQARAIGYTRVVLETGTLQPHAIALYRSAGFRSMPCYGHYVHDPYSVCFEKELSSV